MPLRAIDLPFREQSEFLRRKLNMTTEAWTDVYAQQHDYSFMVAGANRNDLVVDFRRAVQRVIDDGESLEQFRSRFDEIVARYGWSYNGGRNWRSRVIYETNLNTTYMAGRFEQLMAVREERPYWMYVHSDAVENPRPLHQAWDGMVLRWDDPWWRTNMPTNGWGCQCRVIALSERDLRRMGKEGPDQAPDLNWEEREIGQRSPGGPRTVRVPEGVDPGFEYQPGRSRLNGFMPPPGGGGGGVSPRGTPPGGAPPARPLTQSNLLPDNWTDSAYVGEFLRRFNAEDQAQVVRDPAGERFAVGAEMFRNPETNVVERPLADRPSLTGALAQTLLSPDEIWTRLEWFSDLQKAVVRRRYLSWFTLPGENEPTVVTWDTGSNGWTAETNRSAERYRLGERVHVREVA